MQVIFVVLSGHENGKADLLNWCVEAKAESAYISKLLGVFSLVNLLLNPIPSCYQLATSIIEHYPTVQLLVYCCGAYVTTGIG